MAAKWAVCGEITATKNGIHLLLDFIPAKETGIPFRYENDADPDSMQVAIREGIEQFLRYLVAKPLPKGELEVPDPDTIRALAEAVDLEYGWNVPADPGRSEKVVLLLAESDPRLAATLFNPITYPALNRPAVAPPPESPPSPGGIAKPESTP
jgi:hypothetical protein